MPLYLKVLVATTGALLLIHPTAAASATGETGTQAKPSLGLDRIDQREQPFSRSYSWTTTAANVHVYIVDSGINITHTDFGGRASSGADLVDGDHNASDCFATGTGIASVTGGTKYGVAKGVRLVAVRVRDCRGASSPALVVAGINWVTAHAIRPAVAALPFAITANSAVDDALRASIQTGITWVVSSGTGSGESIDSCAFSPARVSEALTVARMEIERSTTAGEHVLAGGACTDIAAPDGNPSAFGGGSLENTFGQVGGEVGMTAGVAALVLGKHPEWLPQQVQQAINGNATIGKLRLPVGEPMPNRILFSHIG